MEHDTHMFHIMNEQYRLMYIYIYIIYIYIYITIWLFNIAMENPL